MKQHAYAGVVFDMDGILINSEPLFRRAAQEAARDLGHHLSDETYAMWMGLPPRAVEAAVVESMGPSFPMRAFRDEFRRIWIDHTEQHGMPPQPGMLDLLKSLRERGIPFSVATSTQRDQALRSLELAGMGAFIDVLVAGNEVSEGKPAPEIFLRAAAGIGIAPERCVAMEDSSVGVHAASAARMLTIMVPDLHQPNAATAALARYVIPGTENAARVVLTLFDAQGAHTS
ncbi:MAG: HAD family phosphatase [Gammaproteobacteria bacterium]|nr:HAD family phosphatase [Gammaproteobacteria bacterium]